jgi:hypothetical protein
MKWPWSKSVNTSRSDPIDTTGQSTDPLVVLPTNIIGGRLEDLRILRGQNRYAVADNLYNTDERLYSSVELMAIMIEKSLGDALGNIIAIRSDDNKLTNEEENALEVANEFAININDIGIPKLAYHYTIDLWKYGDAVDLIKFNSDGIKELIPLPMQSVTAVDSRDQINRAINFNEPMISNPKYYVLDERDFATDIPEQVYKKERIIHISFNPRRNMIRDNMGRWTFNVWSVSPINSLIGILAWKQLLIRNDMLWSNRALPREHHKLDLSRYDLSKFSGTFAEKEVASKTAAETAIKAYNDNIKRREADQGYVTGQGVDITYIEPKTSNWRDPNPIIDQINGLINGPTGAPSALMGGESKGFTSLVHSSSFMSLRAEIYAGVIQRKLEQLVKRHVGLARPGIRDDVVDRLYIKNRLILDRDRTELAKIVAVLVDSNSFTVDEIRAIWGLDPLTELQAKQIIDWVKNTRQKSNISAGNLLRQNPESPTRDQESQGKRSRDINQRGESIDDNR